jgi:signal transduction histidine kinase
VLACQLLPDGSAWEDPLPLFARTPPRWGTCMWSNPDELDSVGRSLPLEEFTGRVRRWALSLEAYRLSRGARILGIAGDLDVGGRLIPAARAGGRLMRIRYAPPSMQYSARFAAALLKRSRQRASEFAGKVVFAGVTSQTACQGLALHALLHGHPDGGRRNPRQRVRDHCPRPVPYRRAAIRGVGVQPAAGVGHRRHLQPLHRTRGEWLGRRILIVAHVTPYWLFTHRVVFSFCTPVSAAWLSLITAGGYQLLVVRRSLRKSEAERDRYRQTIHFVTHEMRTPLTAIQGSSELMGRYALPEEKRKQIAELINAESKRLGRMIEMFLSMERLSAGQVELKKETFAPAS